MLVSAHAISMPAAAPAGYPAGYPGGVLHVLLR
jgi:hypothetical protein